MTARADIGIAMGALGSDAAIEAADVVLMTGEPSKIVSAIRMGGCFWRCGSDGYCYFKCYEGYEHNSVKTMKGAATLSMAAAPFTISGLFAGTLFTGFVAGKGNAEIRCVPLREHIIGVGQYRSRDNNFCIGIIAHIRCNG